MQIALAKIARHQKRTDRKKTAQRRNITVQSTARRNNWHVASEKYLNEQFAVVNRLLLSMTSEFLGALKQRVILPVKNGDLAEALIATAKAVV